MAATIEVVEGTLWSAQNWFFDVALRAFAAAPVSDALKVEINEIMDDNIGWFSFTDASQTDHAILREYLLGGAFIAHVEAGLPADLPNREGALAHAAQLVTIAQRSDVDASAERPA